MNVPPEEALALKAPDPAVCAGLYVLQALPWRVPGGAIAFRRTRFPRSIAEALDRPTTYGVRSRLEPSPLQ